MKDICCSTVESAWMRLGQGQVTYLCKPEFLKQVKEKNRLHSLLKQEMHLFSQVNFPSYLSLSFFFFFFLDMCKQENIVNICLDLWGFGSPWHCLQCTSVLQD